MRHWLNSPFTLWKGPLSEVRSRLPEFERQTLSVAQPGRARTGLNTRLDTIVRLPIKGEDDVIPVGVVSKSYTLIQHTDALGSVEDALRTNNIDSENACAELLLTELGERMHLSVFLPEEYRFDPGDGHAMTLRLECINSVDGSTRLRAMVGWFRFVCANGLVVGVTRSDLHRRHSQELRLEDMQEVLTQGLRQAAEERREFERWRQAVLPRDRLRDWVNHELKARWGFKAAARIFHISFTGRDAEVVGSYRGSQPSSIAMLETKPVPGAPEKCRTVFDLSQALAWLAGQRPDVQEQLTWRDDIPELLSSVLN